MENNAKIRERMNTYRSILLALVWIMAGIGIIAGLILAGNRYTSGIGIGVAIGSVVIGVIGHFFVNVFLAIPFILLNNGDLLATLVGGEGKEVPITGTTNNPSLVVKPEGVAKQFIVKSMVALRSGPGNEFDSSSTLREGDVVDKFQDKGEWSMVRTKDGSEGWCFSSCISSK